MEFRFSQNLDFSYLPITWTKIAFPFELVSLSFPFPLKIREIDIPLYVQLFNRFNPKKPYLWRWDSSIVRGWAVSQAENSKSRTNQSQALSDRISVGLRHQSVIFSLIPDVLRAVEEEGGGGEDWGVVERAKKIFAHLKCYSFLSFQRAEWYFQYHARPWTTLK